MKKFEPGHNIPSLAVIDDPFDIEIVDDSIDPNWATTVPTTNVDKTLGAFFSYDSRPAPSPDNYDEWYKWFTSHKMLIENFETRKIYWVKWEDGMPWRPIEIEGWATKDVFVFSQFGNPWHGFLVAIDARTRNVLLSLQLEYWC